MNDDRHDDRHDDHRDDHRDDRHDDHRDDHRDDRHDDHSHRLTDGGDTSEQQGPDDEFSLTRAQQRAARTIDRNVTVEAGAGTGKTTTLTERYLTILRAHLDGPERLASGRDEPPYRLPDDIDRITDPAAARRLPERIVVTTFTDRAAEDLKRSIRAKIRERLATIDDPDRWAVWRAAADGVEAGYIDTTHGFCSRILKEYAITHPDVDPDFEVMEADDTARIRQTVATELVEAEPPATEVLASVFDRRTLVDVLVGLVAEADMTEMWIDEIREVEDPEAYEAHLVELHPLDADPKRLLDDIADDLGTLADLYGDEAVADKLGANPMKRVGNDVLALYGDLTGVGIETVSPIERLSLCLRLCDAFTNGNGGRYADGTYYGNKAFRESDDATTTRFRAAMDGVLDTLEPERQPTDASLDPDRDAHEVLVALADLAESTLEEYADRKRRRGVLDYNDLIGHTLAFLTGEHGPRDAECRAESDGLNEGEHSGPAGTAGDTVTAVAELRENLRYVMVDEFQDTNTRQWQLVQALTSGSDAFDADNVCVVGDVKQSIYRFRDADVTVFGDAADTMHAANAAKGLVDCDPGLDTNFRTIPETLHAINGLFDHVFGYGDTAPYEAVSGPLVAGRDTPESLDPVVEYLPVPVEEGLRVRYLGADHDLTALPESEPADIEAAAIANRIAGLLNAGTPVTDDGNGSEGDADTRPVEPEDVAVLIRSRSDLKDYERGLREANVPYTVIKGVGFFETPEIRALVSLLSALADPMDDVALYAAARSPVCGLTDTQLATAVAATGDGTNGAKEDDGVQDSEPLWNALQASDDPDVSTVVTDCKRWREYAGTGDTPGASVDGWVTLLDRILAETGYLAAIAADERGTAALANVDKLRDKLREFDTNGVASLDRVSARLTEQADQGRSEAEANDIADATGVRIMTVHEAKGQEYPVVVVPGLGKGFNDRARLNNGSIEYERVPVAGERRPLLGLNLPTDDRTGSEATLMRHVTRDRRRAEEHAEEKRILYVAATRAEDHLVLTGRHQADDDHETGVDQPDPEDPSSYRDWLQPALFGTDGSAVDRWDTLESTGAFTTTLSYELDGEPKTGSVTVRLPPETVRYDHDPDPVPATTSRTAYGYEQPWEFRLSASDLSRIPSGNVALRIHDDTRRVTAGTTADDDVSEGDRYEDDYPRAERAEGVGTAGTAGDDSHTATGRAGGVPAAIYGHAVHRLCETRPPTGKRRRVIDQAIREQHDRAAGASEATYPEAAYDAIEADADAAIAFLDDLHARLAVEHTHDEYYIELELDTGTVGGFIDHLVVTPAAYHIVDYKTDRKPPGREIDGFLRERAAHHRPQLVAYAAALAQQDPTRDVSATLYFTDVDEPFTWEPAEFDDPRRDATDRIRSILRNTPVEIGS